LGHHKEAESPAMLEASWRTTDAVVAHAKSTGRTGSGSQGALGHHGAFGAPCISWYARRAKRCLFAKDWRARRFSGGQGDPAFCRLARVRGGWPRGRRPARGGVAAARSCRGQSPSETLEEWLGVMLVDRQGGG
jgi:hypothetical protein